MGADWPDPRLPEFLYVRRALDQPEPTEQGYYGPPQMPGGSEGRSRCISKGTVASLSKDSTDDTSRGHSRLCLREGVRPLAIAVTRYEFASRSPAATSPRRS